MGALWVGLGIGSAAFLFFAGIGVSVALSNAKIVINK